LYEDIYLNTLNKVIIPVLQLGSSVALQERETIEILCKKYDLHPNQVSQWKRSFKEEGSKVFEKSIGHDELSEKDRLIAELYRQIGELKVDNDWLKKKLR
jgi:transposase-like protein